MGTTLAAARPAGGCRLLRAVGGLLIAAVLLGPGQIVRADHETRDGLYTETEYIGVQFIYQFVWESPWEADLDSIESVEGEYDRIVVRGPDATVEVVLAFENDAEEVLEALIDARAEQVDDLEVVGRDETVDGFDFPVVSATLSYEAPDADGDEVRQIEYVEVGYVYSLDGNGGTLTLNLVAPAEELEDAYQEVQDVFVPHRGLVGPFFAGQPNLDGDADDRDRGDDDGDEPDSGEDDEDERGTGTGLDDDAYESPTYGYTVEWDPDVWEPTEATSEDGVDTLVLASRDSSLYFFASEHYRGDPEDCIEELADWMSADEGVDDWKPLEDEDGEQVAGERRDRAWAVFTLTYTTASGDEYENTNYLECRTLGEGGAALAIVHITSQDAYADEAEAVAEVLDTIDLADEAVDRDADDRSGANRDRDRGEDDDADTDAERATYVSPTWGYTVTWDPAVWTTIWEVSREDGDFLSLGPIGGGGVLGTMVNVNGFAGYDGDPEACLAGLVAEVEEDLGRPLAPAEGVDLPATAPGAVADVYEDRKHGLLLYYECRAVVPGEAVVQIILGVDAADYDEVLPAFEDILAAFQLSED